MRIPPLRGHFGGASADGCFERQSPAWRPKKKKETKRQSSHTVSLVSLGLTGVTGIARAQGRLLNDKGRREGGGRGLCLDF